MLSSGKEAPPLGTPHTGAWGVSRVWQVPDASETLQPCPLATCCHLNPAGLTQAQTDVLGWVGCPGFQTTQSLLVPTSKASGPTMQPRAHHHRPLSPSCQASASAPPPPLPLWLFLDLPSLAQMSLPP